MPRFRARLADALEGVWRDAGRPHGLSAKVPLESWAILATGPELQSLIAELRTDDHVTPGASRWPVSCSSTLEVPSTSPPLVTAGRRPVAGLPGASIRRARLMDVLASVFSGGGTPVADVAAIAIAIVTFVLLFWAINLIDRI